MFPALVAAIFGQKTTGRQADHSWRYLVVRYGSAAPGPAPHGLRVEPSAQERNLIPSWAWHRAGVQPSQSRAAIAASGVAASVDRLASLDAGDERVGAGLRSIPEPPERGDGLVFHAADLRRANIYELIEEAVV